MRRVIVWILLVAIALPILLVVLIDGAGFRVLGPLLALVLLVELAALAVLNPLFLPMWAWAYRLYQRGRAMAVLSYVDQAIRLRLPLADMLHAAAAGEQGALRNKLHRLAQRLDTGASLGQALDQDLPELPRHYRQLLTAAEARGQLPVALSRLIRLHRTHRRPNTIYWGYPLLLLLTAGLIFFGMGAFVFPKFEKIAQDYDSALPPITQSLMAFGQWLGGRLYPTQMLPGILIVLVGMGVLFGMAWLIWSRQWGIPLVDALGSLIAPLRTLTRARGLADACSLLAQSMRMRIPLPEAIREVQPVPQSPALRRQLGAWAAGIERGTPAHEAARQAQLPELLASMLGPAAAGQHAAEVFEFLSRYYDTRFSRALAMVRGALEPATVLLLGAGVAWIVVGMFLPLVQWIHDSAAATGFL